MIKYFYHIVYHVILFRRKRTVPHSMSDTLQRGKGIRIQDGGGEMINQQMIFLGQLKLVSHHLWNTILSAFCRKKHINVRMHLHQVWVSGLSPNSDFATCLLWTLSKTFHVLVLPYL